MNKIDVVRNQVLAEMDTAQRTLDGFLDGLDAAHAEDLRFDVAFHGDLDFSVLKDRGFRKVKKILFEREGEVTNLFNIPEGIVELSMTNQLVVRVDKLPATLETLNLSDNHITKFDAAVVPKLQTLIISNNELTEITNLPESLKILECANNQLRRLDLAGTPALNTLICSNNPILVLEHVPPSLVNLEMENNPFVEIDRSQPTQNSKKHNNLIFDYRESLNEYLRMKHSYETKSLKLKRSAFEKGSSIKEGSRRARAVKPSCVSCGRNVGTTFTHTDNHYRAKCGDSLKPCKLDIDIYTGQYIRFDQMLELYRRDIQDGKQQIIVQKMDTLFKYIREDTSAKKFKENLKNYNQTSEMQTKMLNEYNKIYNDTERAEHIRKKVADIYRIREDISKLFDEYKKSGNREIMIAAVEMYMKDLTPAIQNMRLMKYESVFVETISEDPPVTKMISREISDYRMDILFGAPPKVLKFVVE
jgi:Leucine-rich repeat (LRR) protein